MAGDVPSKVVSGKYVRQIVTSAPGPQGPAGTTGATGPTGPTGPRGDSLVLLGRVDTINDLPSGANQNDAYIVNENDRVYVWNGTVWVDAGDIIGPTGPTGAEGERGKYLVSATAPTSPLEGDVWFDTNSGRTYVYYDSFWVETSPNNDGPVGPTGPAGPIGPTGPTGAQGRYLISDSAPSGALEGDVWFDTNSGRTYIYYDSFWVESSPNNDGPIGPTGPTGPKGDTGEAGSFLISATAPSSPADGDVWFDTITGRLYVFYDSYWVQPGV